MQYVCTTKGLSAQDKLVKLTLMYSEQCKHTKVVPVDKLLWFEKR